MLISVAELQSEIGRLYGQDRFTVSEVGWIGFDMRLQALKIWIHNNIPPLKFVVCYLGFHEIATVRCVKFSDDKSLGSIFLVHKFIC